MIGSAAYKAGMDRGDEIMSIAGTAIAAQEDVTKALAGHKAGEEIALVFRRRGQEVHATATLAESNQLELVPVEETGATLSADQNAFREGWLNSKVKP
jgi:S1-C subfamily serine protease